MGKGDKKTRRGKIIMGSYGKLRPRRRKFRVRSRHVKAEAPDPGNS
ncbi:30S ribosomal protein THX [Sinomicrobium soli]|nr:30S ribosomal protein THX [Sinomicrobium sp. N-1-3-6]RAV29823.1 30S ribosomal protein THX [Sinomicrobium sp. N-1-3-6]